MTRRSTVPKVGTTCAGLVAAVCLAATPAPAQTTDRASSEPREASRPEFRQDDGRSRFRRELDRADVQLESLSAFHWMRLPGSELHHDQVLSDTLVDEVATVALRAGRRAARDYLFQVASVDDWVANLRGRVGDGGSSRGAATGLKRLDWDLGVHSAVPEAGLRYFVGSGELGFALGADGEVGLRFRARGVEPAQVGVSFDGDETYRFNFSFGF